MVGLGELRDTQLVKLVTDWYIVALKLVVRFLLQVCKTRFDTPSQLKVVVNSCVFQPTWSV